MTERAIFQNKVNEILSQINPEILAYDESEFWMIERRYVYVENYAYDHQLLNTAIALPLVRGLHDGGHRKSPMIRDGVAYKIPYVIHCLMVCRMLIDLQLPISREEEDIALASALCHDLIEDIPFENHGWEMVTDFHLDPRVYETVKTLSKRKDFTEEEHRAYFRGIQEDPLAVLVKLADRGNNVEDLYNMSIWKTHEYVGETRECIFPMYTYAREHFPELNGSLTILYEKMKTLTQVAEILVNRYEDQDRHMNEKLVKLREENERLRGILKEMEE